MRIRIALPGTLLLVFSYYATGQEITATILGTVTDSSGAVVSGATIIVLNHTNFDQIGTFFLFDPIHFGRVVSARDPRIIQLGLKVLF
jgi:hypothetical protein